MITLGQGIQMVVPLTQAKLNYRERNGFTERHSQHDSPTHGSHGYYSTRTDP